MCECLEVYMYVRVFIGVYAWKFMYVRVFRSLYVCASV